MFDKPDLSDVLTALEAIKNIPHPDADIEGDPINSDSVSPHLSSPHQAAVDKGEMLAKNFTRDVGDIDQDAINALRQNGYDAYLGPDQYAQDLFRGYIVVGDWHLDISDQPVQSHD